MAATDTANMTVQDFLDQAADMGAGRLERYRTYEDYYTGEAVVPLRDRARQYLDRSGLGYNENYCDTVVDVLAERVRVIGFASNTADDIDPDEDEFASVLEDWWGRLDWDLTQAAAHTQAMMKGDAFLLLDWDPDRAVPVLAFNRPEIVKPVYGDDHQEMLYAAKLWNTTARSARSNPDGRSVQRLNVFWPDRIERWFRPHNGEGQQSGGWEPWLEDGDNMAIVPWTGPDGRPLGIPVFHLRHLGLGAGYGRSRLRSVVPFQDAINKIAIDLEELVDNHGLPQRWAAGVTGDTVYKSVAGNVWQSAGEQAKFGQLDASPTSNLLDAIEGAISRMARRSRTPMHLLTGGTPPSGEALKTAESGLVAAALACQTEFGAVWEKAMLMALNLAAANGAVAAAPDDLTLDVQWATAETRHEKDELEAAMIKKELGVSKRTLLRELGYDPEREAEYREQEQREQADLMSESFDAGRPSATGFPDSTPL